MRQLLVISAVICALIGSGWAQNRGSSRYVPSEFEEDIARAPRPTRLTSARRQRITTKAPESAAVEDEVKAFQPADNPVRTTGRRVPQRGSPRIVAPPPPPPLPVDDTAPQFVAPTAESPADSPAAPVSTTPNTRRRRPKKRRRPQNTVPKETEEPEKQILVARNDEKTLISDLINEDKKRNGVFQTNLSSRNSLPTYNSDSSYQSEKSQWENKQSPEIQNNAAGPYYKPQPAVNRLPVGDSDPVGNSRGYLESSVPLQDTAAPYVPPTAPKDTSYVPILTPVRGPSDGSSRLPPENYPGIQNKDATRHSGDPNVPLRGHSNRSPVATIEEISRAKPVLNTIPQSDELSGPVRSHSEVRLPDDQPLINSPYAPSTFDSSEDVSAPNAKLSEDIKIKANPSNRLPNPSEIHYDSPYPQFSDDQVHVPQRVATRRQETEEPAVRNPLPSYTIPRRDIGTKPHEYDNDAEVDRSQVSQYRPPLQRAGSRFKADDPNKLTERSREQIQSQSIPATRTRGSIRYQPSTTEHVPERTRTNSEADSPTRSRSSTPSQSNTRTRGIQRFSHGSVEPARGTPFRKPLVDVEEINGNTATTGYIPIDEFVKNEEKSEKTSAVRSHSQPSARELRNKALDELTPIRGTLRTVNQPPSRAQTDKELDELTPIRGTLRSRPQYEARKPDPTDRFEESIEEPNVYRPDYHSHPQVDSRTRLNQAAPYPNHPAPQPAYQSPPSRQQNRPEPPYESPQNYRSRPQPQYQAPQNPRTDPRQQLQYQAPQNPRTDHRQQLQYQVPQNPGTDSRKAISRQNLPSGTHSRLRPQSKPAGGSPRSSTGKNNFKCPDEFGFFADPVQCDKYYECRNGTAEMHVCNDGLAFNEISAPKYLRCDYLRDVDCSSRPELQEPQPTQNCLRRFGLFPHETDCTKFWNCVDGVATEVQCPPGLTYSHERATCDWADLVESSCKSEDLLGFTCPEPTAHDLKDGIFTRYPHPDNCQLHFTCIKGPDGLRRPRMMSCNEGLVFDPVTTSCKRPEEVPGCESFYGVRSQAPKKKPARGEPEPISEEIIEEPTPRPRRRGPIRRVRS